jgi:hypothetical protein
MLVITIEEKKILLEITCPAKIKGIEHKIGNRFGDSLKRRVSDDKIKITE